MRNIKIRKLSNLKELKYNLKKENLSNFQQNNKIFKIIGIETSCGKNKSTLFFSFFCFLSFLFFCFLLFSFFCLFIYFYLSISSLFYFYLYFFIIIFCCLDDTAVGIVSSDGKILSNIKLSQVKLLFLSHSFFSFSFSKFELFCSIKFMKNLVELFLI